MVLPQANLQVHHFEPISSSNGPGHRAVLWLQGCTLACPGCFNPETHPIHSGYPWTVEEIVSFLKKMKTSIEGITLSGGEPLQQIEAVNLLLQEVRRQTQLSVIVFTGYSVKEAQSLSQFATFSTLVDVLISGRYRPEIRQAHSLLGSANKECIFFTTRYSPRDLDLIPPAEIFISKDGEITLSGITPISWK